MFLIKKIIFPPLDNINLLKSRNINIYNFGTIFWSGTVDYSRMSHVPSVWLATLSATSKKKYFFQKKKSSSNEGKVWIYDCNGTVTTRAILQTSSAKNIDFKRVFTLITKFQENLQWNLEVKSISNSMRKRYLISALVNFTFTVRIFCGTPDNSISCGQKVRLGIEYVEQI